MKKMIHGYKQIFHFAKKFKGQKKKKNQTSKINKTHMKLAIIYCTLFCHLIIDVAVLL